jgi:hypothetical protein
MTKNWPQDQNTIWKIEPGVKISYVNWSRVQFTMGFKIPYDTGMYLNKNWKIYWSEQSFTGPWAGGPVLIVRTMIICMYLLLQWACVGQVQKHTSSSSYQNVTCSCHDKHCSWKIVHVALKTNHSLSPTIFVFSYHRIVFRSV